MSSKYEWIIELEEFPKYFISNYGRIFSEKRGDRIEMKGIARPDGYLQVILTKNGKTYNKRIHRLVCETFLKRVEGKNEVDHIFRNKLDNRLCNLHWVNRRENAINRGIQKNNTSGIKGVRWRENRKSWIAYIQVEVYKEKSKSFKKKQEAINWRLDMEKKYYKEVEEEKVEEEYPGRNWRDEGNTKYLFENF